MTDMTPWTSGDRGDVYASVYAHDDDTHHYEIRHNFDGTVEKKRCTLAEFAKYQDWFDSDSTELPPDLEWEMLT